MKKMDSKRTVSAKKKHFHPQNRSLISFVRISMVAFAAVVLLIGCRIAESKEQKEVYAAAEAGSTSLVSAEDSRITETSSGEEDNLPTGIAGVASGLETTPSAGSTLTRFGTSYDDVIVGQRTQTVGNGIKTMDISSSMESTVNMFDSAVVNSSASATLMSDEDYANLLQIVEAEAGTEDVKGRVLVANVIMNRVNYPEFPDTITEVIYEYRNGVAQFSPVSDGRISQVTPSDKTKEAVKQVLEGADYSEGALFFIQKSEAAAQNVEWFEKNLKRLFKHGVHEFYTYPDDVLKAAESADGSTETKASVSLSAVSADGASMLIQMTPSS